MKRFLCVLAIALFVAAIAASESCADDPASGARYRLMLAPHATVGYVLQGADELEYDKYLLLLYGGGLSAETGLSSRSYVGARCELLWKVHPLKGVRFIRGASWDLTWLWLMNPGKRTTFYAAPALGLIHIWWPDVPETYHKDANDWDLGTHVFIRLGCGHQIWCRNGLVNRLEVYFKWILSKGSEEAQLARHDENVLYLGLSLTIGIPLLH